MNAASRPHVVAGVVPTLVSVTLAVFALSGCAPHPVTPSNPPHSEATAKAQSFCETLLAVEGPYLDFAHRYAVPDPTRTVDQARADSAALASQVNRIIETAPAELTPEIDAFLAPWLQLNQATSSIEPSANVVVDVAAVEAAADKLHQHCEAK